MRCNDVIKFFEQLSPESAALEWDNVGLLIGRRDKEIRRIYIALDATDDVIRSAIDWQADMLLTHHPLIFGAVKKINTDNFITRRILKLASHDMCYYAMHTNFDVYGMADAAAEALRLRRTSVLDVTETRDEVEEGIGRVGRLPKVMSLRECSEYVKHCFDLEHVRVYGDMDAVLENAAVSPGSGKSEIKNAIRKGADVLITGDIEHHEGIDAVAQGLTIIDAGHYGIEKLFIDYMKEYIREGCPGMAVMTHPLSDPFSVV